MHWLVTVNEWICPMALTCLVKLHGPNIYSFIRHRLADYNNYIHLSNRAIFVRWSRTQADFHQLIYRFYECVCVCVVVCASLLHLALAVAHARPLCTVRCKCESVVSLRSKQINISSGVAHVRVDTMALATTVKYQFGWSDLMIINRPKPGQWSTSGDKKKNTAPTTAHNLFFRIYSALIIDK